MFNQSLYFSSLKTENFGRSFRWFETLDSTNAFLMDSNSETGSVVCSDIQTKGRGRSGRSWFTSPDSLSFSLVLPIVKTSFLLPMNILAGYSVADALRHYAPVYVKWPNDCVIERGKVCGMLIETRFKGSVLERSVLGIGINIGEYDFPEKTVVKAASIASYYKSEIHKEIILANILNRLEYFIYNFIEEKVNISSLWNSYSANINKKITFHRGLQTCELTELGINSEGSLIAADSDNIKQCITYGEIGYGIGC